jgi:hypothetical protein
MYTQDFTAWWSTYPRKTAKRKAAAFWLIAVTEIASEQNLTKQEAIAWLLERTKLFASSDKGLSGEFCPYPTTWLHQGRYDDDIDEWFDKKQRKPFDVGEWRP